MTSSASITRLRRHGAHRQDRRRARATSIFCTASPAIARCWSMRRAARSTCWKTAHCSGARSAAHDSTRTCSAPAEKALGGLRGAAVAVDPRTAASSRSRARRPSIRIPFSGGLSPRRSSPTLNSDPTKPRMLNRALRAPIRRARPIKAASWRSRGAAVRRDRSRADALLPRLLHASGQHAPLRDFKKEGRGAHEHARRHRAVLRRVFLSGGARARHRAHARLS